MIFACCISFVAASVFQSFDTWGHARIQLTDVLIHFRYSTSGKPPLLLVHGFPEHSPTWYIIGPLLAEHYTVIAPDNRGAGDSSLSTTNNYTAPAGGEDLRAILDFLNMNRTYVFAYDKGVGLAVSLAIEHPELVAPHRVRISATGLRLLDRSHLTRSLPELAACFLRRARCSAVLHPGPRERHAGVVLFPRVLFWRRRYFK